MDDLKARDDALFEALGKSKKQKKRKKLITTVSVIAIAAVLLVVLVSVLRKQVDETMSAMDDEVLTYTVAYGSISTTVSGSGTITDVDTEELTVPDGVEILEVLVKSNTQVHEGDVLATVDTASVVRAMADLQAEIDTLDLRLSSSGSDKVSTYLNAGVSGRVKKIYAQKGDDVAACMSANGALAVFSQDGYMALDLQADALQVGDSVTVVRADGSEISGSVEKASGGTATILVSDNGPELEETVTVKSSDGTELGSGVLYIHNPLSVTGFTGTIYSVNVRENQYVYAGNTVFTLTDTSYSANYDSILAERRDKEETLLILMSLYRSGALCAPFDGTVLSVEYDSSASQSSPYAAQSTAGVDGTQVLTMSRDEQMSVTVSVDETDILALQVGQEAVITIESLGGVSCSGVVTEVDKTAVSDSGVTAYSATVTFDKAENMLSGMTADVKVTITGIDHVLIVPVDAVHRTSSGAYVYTSYDEEAKEFGGTVNVTTGVETEDYIEIVSGLREGDAVCYIKNEKAETQNSALLMGRG